jgi:hypothetical protein
MHRDSHTEMHFATLECTPAIMADLLEPSRRPAFHWDPVCADRSGSIPRSLGLILAADESLDRVSSSTRTSKLTFFSQKPFIDLQRDLFLLLLLLTLLAPNILIQEPLLTLELLIIIILSIRIHVMIFPTLQSYPYS